MFSPVKAVPLKKTPLTVRGCPQRVYNRLKKSARSNRRSLNSETLAWLEKQSQAKASMTGKELADLLRQFKKSFTREEHTQIASAIEAYRRKNRDDSH